MAVLDIDKEGSTSSCLAALKEEPPVLMSEVEI